MYAASMFSRVLLLPVTWWGVVTLTFLLLRLTPGDPVANLLGEAALPEQVEAMRQTLGLNAPLWQQYTTFWIDLLSGNWGESFMYHRPVLDLLLERFVPTLTLAAWALGLSVYLAIPAGMVSARWHNKWPDKVLQVVTSFLLALPSFVLGPLLLLALALYLPILPTGGNDSLKHIFLPALTLGLPTAALLTRQLRAALLEVRRAPYAQTAKAKGATPARMWDVHLLPNAMGPLLTVLFLQAGALLTGAILVETIFSWPGLGKLLVDALSAKDYPVIQGCVLLIALSYTLATLANDVVQSLLNKRGGDV